jgi:hypothetical protein
MPHSVKSMRKIIKSRILMYVIAFLSESELLTEFKN